MLKWIPIGLLLAAALVQAWLLQFDYYVHVGDRYAILNDMEQPGWAILQFIEPAGIDFPHIRNVRTYAPSGDTVVGTTDRGFFLADADGNITEYRDRIDWQAACQALGAGDATARLGPVSRYQDVNINAVQAGIVAVVLIVLLFYLCVLIVGRPAPSATTPGP